MGASTESGRQTQVEGGRRWWSVLGASGVMASAEKAVLSSAGKSWRDVDVGQNGVRVCGGSWRRAGAGASFFGAETADVEVAQRASESRRGEV